LASSAATLADDHLCGFAKIGNSVIHDLLMQKVPGGSGYNQKLEFYRLEKGDELVWIDDVFDKRLRRSRNLLRGDDQE
jgi:hypothetical protein